MINVQFGNESEDPPSGYVKDIICRVIEKTAEFEGIPCDGEVSVSFVGDDEMQALNRKYRGIDRTTDVLSFPLSEARERREGAYVCFGDIVISMPKAKAQAAEYGHGILREAGFLATHSMLHLLGYDHENAEDEAVMNAKQTAVLDSVGLSKSPSLKQTELEERC